MPVVTWVGGAVEFQLGDGQSVWCPPAWIAGRVGLPFQTNGQAICRPYWTAGPKCPPGKAGPELTDEEIRRCFIQWS